MPTLNNNNGPYSLDYNEITHRNVTIPTIVNAPIFESIARDLDNAYEYEVGFVPAGYEHRPDLIANLFYGDPKNWWLLMYVNNITDPFEGFNLNDRILIPKL